MMRPREALRHARNIPEVSIGVLADRASNPRCIKPCRTIRSGRQEFCPGRQSAKISRAVFLLLGVALLRRRFLLSQFHEIRSTAPYRFPMYGLGCWLLIALQFYFTNFMPGGSVRCWIHARKVGGERGRQAESWADSRGTRSATPRVYEGFTHWIGFLFIRSDRICYVGEEARFSLRTTRLRTCVSPGKSELGSAAKEFTSRGKDESLPSCGVSVLRRRTRNPQKKLYARTTDFVPAIESWRSAKAASRPLPEPLAKLETPQLRESLRNRRERCLRAKNFFRTIPKCLLAAMTAALFGLPFHWARF